MGLLVAEAHQKQPAAQLRDAQQSGDVGPAIRIRQHMEQPAVDHAVELAI
jgi:hypothetical protein